MLKFYELLNKFYYQLLTYYENNDTEFSTLPSVDLLNKTVNSILYKLNNDVHFDYIDVYSQIKPDCFNLLYLNDCLLNSLYVKTSNCSSIKYDNNWSNYCEKNSNDTKENIIRIMFMILIINNFIKKIRFYYLVDFMKNDDLEHEIAQIKHQIKHIFIDNKMDIFYKNSISVNDFIGLIEKKKLKLKDNIKLIIESSKFKKMVLKQQEFYLSELNRLRDAIEEKGNQLHSSDEVFQIYLEFINEFEIMLNENINTLKYSNVDKFRK